MAPQPSNQPCPRCGGADRFFLVTSPRNGRAPFWMCRNCHYTEDAAPGASTGTSAAQRQLTPAEIAQAHQGYAAAAQWAADQLWQPQGAAALAYLHTRGLSDDTIRAAGLGYHSDIWQDAMAAAIYRSDRAAYDGLGLGGLTSRQGRPKSLLRDALTFPYAAGSTVAMLRVRKLNPQPERPKYLAPAGVAYYAGGAPTLYLGDVLAQSNAVILTEGEIKALLAWQHWRAGALRVPAVAQPGIGYLPDALLDALRGKTVYLCYDSEARRDPFTLSPGEQHTIRNGERLTGLGFARQLDAFQRRANTLMRSSDPADQAALQQLPAQVQALEMQAQAAQARGIQVRVVRLPRDADTPKVDLDGFLLAHGAAALQQLLDRAPAFEHWYELRTGGGYRFEQGGIVGAHRVANYQAILVEDIEQHDGLAVTAAHRLALRTPTGAQHTIEVPAEVWADDREARKAVRAGLREGATLDDPKQVLDAIKLLSLRGDGPQRRTAYTATGWQQVGGQWLYLVPDGAIGAGGALTTVRAELDSRAQGNHYALCGAGDAQQGAAAWLRFLRGEVCPQPLALLLAGHAALALLHRFMGSDGRPLLWLHGQSGTLKTALTRAGVLALYGPRFTAERADGAALPKWDSTYNGLELLAFSYRDAPLLIDDYKQATAGRDALPRFLHAYSEGSSRSRMTRDRKHDRTYPARCLAIVTGEDLPPSGDTGQLARALLLAIGKGDIAADALQALQQAGAAGHLAAFWRGFVGELARWLDQKGEAGVQALVQQALRADDAQLPGHKRADGALRLNRAAWLVLSTWLARAGYLDAAEAKALDAAHIAARGVLAEHQAETHHDTQPATIFLNVLREQLATGAAMLDDDATSDTPPERIIGFRTNTGIALYPERTYTLVSDVRARQRQPLNYSATAIWQQLDNDGLLVRKGAGRFTHNVRRSGVVARVLVLATRALEGEPEEDVATVANEDQEWLHSSAASERDKTEVVADVANVTKNAVDIHARTRAPARAHAVSHTATPATVATSPVLPHQNGKKSVANGSSGVATNAVIVATASAQQQRAQARDQLYDDGKAERVRIFIASHQWGKARTEIGKMRSAARRKELEAELIAAELIAAERAARPPDPG